MRNSKINTALAIVFVVVLVVACSFSASTANLSDITLSPNRDGSSPTNTFRPDATVYAITSVNNSMGRVRVRSRVFFDNVEGQESGAMVPGLETTLDVDGSRPVTFSYSTTTGFPPGTYRVEIAMMNEAGEQKDQKTATFTIS
jgi:hypothetical protein